MDTENLRPWPDEAEDPWRGPTPADPRGGPAYARQLEAVRALQDLVAGAVVPDGDTAGAAQVAELVETLAARLRPLQRPERFRRDGMRPDLPGRGHPMLPPYVVEAEDATTMRGTARFGRFYLGGRGAVHGGSHSLLFDDVLGRLANHRQPGIARTAYLHVNYRQIVPVGVELAFDATLDRIEGRKRWATARLRDGDDTVLADAEGLFVELTPGQI